jgi:hypothetical protein
MIWCTTIPMPKGFAQAHENLDQLIAIFEAGI